LSEAAGLSSTATNETQVSVEVLERARQIRLLILDVDGVLTDGSLYLGDNSVEYKTFFSRDGLGMKLMLVAGLQVAIISGRNSTLVKQRMAALGVTHVHLGEERKLPIYKNLIKSLQLKDSEVAYMGDDMVDLPVMEKVGLAMSVADADPVIRGMSHWCAHYPGGRGAVRQGCELILKAQDRWRQALTQHLDLGA
jgi:3-deoxy-D-manno-octulosonate 8-phosphate phosphatase (KDO 8-P phosphatase)